MSCFLIPLQALLLFSGCVTAAQYPSCSGLTSIGDYPPVRLSDLEGLFSLVLLAMLFLMPASLLLTLLATRAHHQHP